MKNSKSEVSLDEVISAQKSIRGRRSRMRKSRSRWSGSRQSPIEKIGVFDSEITLMENALDAMQTRIDNATIKI